MHTYKLKRPLRALSLAFSLAALVPLAHAQWITNDLGTLGGDFSQARAVNAAGQVVGASVTAGLEGHAFIASASGMIDLGTLGGTNSFATAVNASGQVAGSSLLPSGDSHAFLYSEGRMLDLGTLGGTSSSAAAINASGQVTGSSSLAGQPFIHAYRSSGAGMTDLGSLGRSSEGYAINAAGQVVGRSFTQTGTRGFIADDNGMRDLGTLFGSTTVEARAINASGQVTGGAFPLGFLYENGVMTSLGSLGGGESYGMAINDAGQIAGTSMTGVDPVSHGFLFSQGRMIDLGTLAPGDEVFVTAINAAGQVAGSSGGVPFIYREGKMLDVRALATGFSRLSPEIFLNDAGQLAGTGLSDISGENHAFLLTPVAGVPEPSALAMLTAGLGLIGLGRLVRKRRLCANLTPVLRAKSAKKPLLPLSSKSASASCDVIRFAALAAARWLLPVPGAMNPPALHLPRQMLQRRLL